MDAKPYAKDGNSSGKLEGYSIDDTGIVLGGVLLMGGEESIRANYVS